MNTPQSQKSEASPQLSEGVTQSEKNPSDLPFLPPRRKLEWWCVLNAKHRPAELPDGISPDEAFQLIQGQTNQADSLRLWNELQAKKTNIKTLIRP